MEDQTIVAEFPKEKNVTSIKGRSSLKKRLKKYYLLYLIFLPFAAAYIIFCYVPLITGTVMSFQTFQIGKSIFEMPFNHFENYIKLFQNPDIVRAIRNTVIISVLKLVFGFFPPIFLAIFVFDLGGKIYKKTCQTLMYIPYFFSWIVVYGIFFAFFSTETGFINVLLDAMGLSKVSFFTTNGWFLFLLVFSHIWKNMGWGSILYLAGLTSIGPELYEAAKIDGCGPYKRIFYITFPSLMPIVCFSLILSIGGLLGSDMEQILMFYNTSVYEVGDVLSTWVYRVGLSSLRNYSVGIAVGILNGLVGLLLTIAANFTAKKISGRGMW